MGGQDGAGEQEDIEGEVREIERGGGEWSERDSKEGGGGGGRNIATTGGNTRREWGDVWQMTKRVRLHLMLEKLGRSKGRDREVGGQVQG